MSTTLSSASLKPMKKPKNKVVEFIMTTFAVVFVLMPVVIMAMWVSQSIDFSGAGSLVQDVSTSLFGAKER